GERIDESLGPVVDGGKSSGHQSRDRADNQNSPAATASHIVADAVDECQRSSDVGVNHMGNVAERLIQERLAKSVTGVGNERIHDTPVQSIIESAYTLFGRQVGFDRSDLRSQLPQHSSCRSQRPVGSNYQVKAVARALARELQANTARSSRYDCKRANSCVHESGSIWCVSLLRSTKRTPAALPPGH